MAKSQQDIDNKLGEILKKLTTDESLLRLFEIGILDLLDKNMLSDRQIAKKITSYSINPLTGVPFSDRELNFMYYGQDLALDKIYINDVLTPSPGYVPYFTETEDMVSYGAGYTPVDIRDMVKNIINDIKKDVRKEIRAFEDGIKEMFHSIPKAFEQISASVQSLALMLAKASVPVIGALASNPGMFTSIAMALYNAGAILRKIIKDTLKATLVLSTLEKMTIGSTKQINVPSIITPAINGAPPIKKLIKAKINQIPKIKFLIPDEVAGVINNIIFVILSIVDLAADALIAIDTAAITAEILALTTGVPPDVASAAILAAQTAAVLVFKGTIQTAIDAATTTIKSYVSTVATG
jgi:hypothetical protein